MRLQWRHFTDDVNDGGDDEDGNEASFMVDLSDLTLFKFESEILPLLAWLFAVEFCESIELLVTL